MRSPNRSRCPRLRKRRCWPTRSASPSWWYSTPLSRPSGWRSSCTTSSRFLSRRSPRSWHGPRWLPDSWRAGPGGGCSRNRLSPTRPPRSSARWSRPSSPPPARVTSRGLLQLLDPHVALRADAVAVEMAAARASAGAPALRGEVRGVDAVARVFAGGAKAARLSLVDGLAGAVVSVGGRPMAVFGFTVRDGRIAGIEVIADPETLAVLDVGAGAGGSLSGCTRPRGLVLHVRRSCLQPNTTRWRSCAFQLAPILWRPFKCLRTARASRGTARVPGLPGRRRCERACPCRRRAQSREGRATPPAPRSGRRRRRGATSTPPAR